MMSMVDLVWFDDDDAVVVDIVLRRDHQFRLVVHHRELNKNTV